MLRMEDNHNAHCDNMIQWMDFAVGLLVCSLSSQGAFPRDQMKNVCFHCRCGSCGCLWTFDCY